MLLKISLHSEWIQWLSISLEFGYKKTRSRTEFESWALLENLVGEGLIGVDNSMLKELAISKRVSLWEEWCRKLELQTLSWILKSPVRMRTLSMLTSVSLRYFKVDWDESKYTLIRK